MKELKLAEIMKKIELKVECSSEALNRSVTGGYVSDLLSDVMANAKRGNIWVTLQVHPNIVAVAVLKEIAGIIIVGNRKPEPETVKKAEQEKIPIMTTELSGFEIAGRLYEMGIRGTC
ncbi:MAG: DRTGG domain-containing protein [bacterium]